MHAHPGCKFLLLIEAGAVAVMYYEPDDDIEPSRQDWLVQNLLHKAEEGKGRSDLHKTLEVLLAKHEF